MKKHVIILFDGMADYPNENGNTPMVDASKPHTDALAKRAEVGLCKTVPDGMKPGSDVANLSVMGYDPKIYYTGRSPLEALSMGVEMAPSSVSYRTNLVTVSNEPCYADKTMVDYSSGEITTAEARALISFLDESLALPDNLRLFGGVSYRHCLLRKDGNTGAILTPPHDISDRKVAEYLPKGEYADELIAIMERSHELLSNHPINLDRISRGLNPANSVWFWGEGRKPALTPFFDLHGKRGAVISAVDLLKGIGVAAGMEIIDVDGATGNLDSNFDGKAAAAIDALSRNDFVYVHLEAPDECGHQGNYAAKKRAIEIIDEKIVAPIVNHLSALGEPYCIAILPDHATPIALKTHVSDPVPYLVFDTERPTVGVDTLNEHTAAATGNTLPSGVALISKIFG